MVKIVRAKDYKDFKKHIDYGRLVVVKHEDKYFLCLAFRQPQTYDELSHMKARIMFNQVHTKNNGINLYELNVFSSLDNILDYIKTGKIEEVYEKNLCTMSIVPIKTNSAVWYVKNFKLNKEKLKFVEVKSRLLGWVPDDKVR